MTAASEALTGAPVVAEVASGGGAEVAEGDIVVEREAAAAAAPSQDEAQDDAAINPAPAQPRAEASVGVSSCVGQESVKEAGTGFEEALSDAFFSEGAAERKPSRASALAGAKKVAALIAQGHTLDKEADTAEESSPSKVLRRRSSTNKRKAAEMAEEPAAPDGLPPTAADAAATGDSLPKDHSHSPTAETGDSPAAASPVKTSRANRSKANGTGDVAAGELATANGGGRTLPMRRVRGPDKAPRRRSNNTSKQRRGSAAKVAAVKEALAADAGSDQTTEAQLDRGPTRQPRPAQQQNQATSHLQRRARAAKPPFEEEYDMLYGCTKCRYTKTGCGACRDKPLAERPKLRWQPSDAHLQDGVPHAPTFYPTAEEFQDPLTYINSVRPKAEACGIMCIVPPEGWAPPFALEKGTNGVNADSFRFSIRKQLTSHLCMRVANQVKEKAAGPARGYGATVKGEGEGEDDGDFGFVTLDKKHTLKSFAAYADWVKTVHFSEPAPEKHEGARPLKRSKYQQYSGPEPSVEEVEGEFWRIVEKPNDVVESLYGQDLDSGHHGSGFPLPPFRQKLLEKHLAESEDAKPVRKGKTESLTGPLGGRAEDEAEQLYSKHLWNINNLPRNAGSVLRYVLGDELITGVMVPWLYVGSCMSAFCWHIEDHALYSINYLHNGAPKVWYGVPAHASQAMEEAMHDALPHLFEATPNLMYNLVTMVSPKELRARGVPVHKLVHHEGSFVITLPNAYHAGFNTGFNCAEAVNFGPPDWLPWGTDITEKYRRDAKPLTLSHDALLVTLVSAAEPVSKYHAEHPSKAVNQQAPTGMDASPAAAAVVEAPSAAAASKEAQAASNSNAPTAEVAGALEEALEEVGNGADVVEAEAAPDAPPAPTQPTELGVCRAVEAAQPAGAQGNAPADAVMADAQAEGTSTTDAAPAPAVDGAALTAVGGEAAARQHHAHGLGSAGKKDFGHEAHVGSAEPLALARISRICGGELGTLDPVYIETVPLQGIRLAAGELDRRAAEERRRWQAASDAGIDKAARMSGAPGAFGPDGLNTDTTDMDCLVCKTDLWLSSVVSPACPGQACCPEHGAALPGDNAAKTLLYRYTVDELHALVQTAVRCIDGTAEVVEAAKHRAERLKAMAPAVNKLPPIIAPPMPVAAAAAANVKPAKRKYVRRPKVFDDDGNEITVRRKYVRRNQKIANGGVGKTHGEGGTRRRAPPRRKPDQPVDAPEETEAPDAADAEDMEAAAKPKRKYTRKKGLPPFPEQQVSAALAKGELPTSFQLPAVLHNDGEPGPAAAVQVQVPAAAAVAVNASLPAHLPAANPIVWPGVSVAATLGNGVPQLLLGGGHLAAWATTAAPPHVAGTPLVQPVALPGQVDFLTNMQRTMVEAALRANGALQPVTSGDPLLGSVLNPQQAATISPSHPVSSAVPQGLGIGLTSSTAQPALPSQADAAPAQLVDSLMLSSQPVAEVPGPFGPAAVLMPEADPAAESEAQPHANGDAAEAVNADAHCTSSAPNGVTANDRDNRNDAEGGQSNLALGLDATAPLTSLEAEAGHEGAPAACKTGMRQTAADTKASAGGNDRATIGLDSGSNGAETDEHLGSEVHGTR